MYKNILFLGINCLRLLMLNPFHAGFYFTHMYSFVRHIYICVCVCVCVCMRALEITPLNIMENESC